MNRILLILIAVVSVVTPCVAGWDGWPLEGNTNAFTWEKANETYGSFTQLVYGAVERYGPGRNRSGPPTMTRTISVYGGRSNYTQMVTNNYGVFPVTNSDIAYNVYTQSWNIAPTAFVDTVKSFTYNYVDPADSLSYTATGFPSICVVYFSWLEAVFFHYDPDLAGDVPPLTWYCVSNYYDGTYNEWFEEAGSLATNHPADFPMNDAPGLFSREDIGQTFGMATNQFGLVTGTNAYFHVQTPPPTGFLLAESHCTTSAWNVIQQIPTLQASPLYGQVWALTVGTNRPVIEYVSGGTNPIGTHSVTVQGYGFKEPLIAPEGTSESSDIPVATSEVVVVTTSNTALTIAWTRITNIVIAASPSNVLDTMTFRYTAMPELLNQTPYALHAYDLDERQRALAAMVHTRASAKLTNGVQNGRQLWEGFGWSQASTNMTWTSTNATYPAALTISALEPTLNIDGMTIVVTNVTRANWDYRVLVSSSGSFDITNSTASPITANWYVTNQTVVPGVPIVSKGDSGSEAIASSTQVHVAWTITDCQWDVSDIDNPNQGAWAYGTDAGTIQNYVEQIDSVSYVSSYIQAYRWHGAIGVSPAASWDQIFTHVGSAKDIYLRGVEHGKTVTNYVWEPESVVASLSNAMYRFMQSVVTNVSADATYDITATLTNAPYYGEALTEKGWGVNGALWLRRWDVPGGFSLQ